MGLFQEALAGGLASIRQAAGVTILIRRNGVVSLPITAAKGRAEFIQENDEGNVVAQWRGDDYLIAVEDYVIDGVTTKPEVGDTYDETIGAEAATAEVVSPGPEPAWRYSDQGQTQFRVHTRRVGVE